MTSRDPSDFRLGVSILGVPVAFETNSAEVLEVARAAYEPWESPSLNSRVPRVRVIVHAGAADIVDGEPAVELPEPHRLVLRLRDGDAHADASLGEAEAHVGPSSVRADDFREGLLDHLALFLVTALDRCPIHASAIVHDGKAVLLAGASGMGKSSLTYAAMRAGYRVLADDAVYIERGAHRLWGMPRRVHLSPDAVRHFPELGGRATTLRPDGRRKIPVDIPSSSRADVPWSGPVGLIVLSRSSPTADVERISPAAAAADLRMTLQGGFARFSESLDDCLPMLTSGGCWRLQVTVEPSALVRRLDMALSGD
jgi:hypothetical protein